MPLLIITGYYFKLSKTSYTFITAFIVLHVIGSHYTYALVPFGDTLQAWFGSDRLVHFSFGLLLAYPLFEVFRRLAKVKGAWAYYFPIELVLAFSAAYKIIEWKAATFIDPAAGLAFLGTQGDIWDAQKDMLLALIGALLAMLITFIVRRHRPAIHSGDISPALRGVQ